MAASLETQHPIKAFGWAANDNSAIFTPTNFSRRATGELDVQFKVLYCGICHSDLHLAKNEWGFTAYPLIPGHEIVGVVTEIGAKVTKFKKRDIVGVGCWVGSCRECEECRKNDESYCPKIKMTVSGTFFDGTPNFGGFSDIMVVDEHFVIRWPENLALDKGAPLLCAGITTYSPMRRFGLDRPGIRLGVVGLGGIGHLTVKFAKAFGCKVTVVSSSVSKKEEAVERFGADEFLVSTDQEQMQAAVGTLDGIIDTVSANHSLLPLDNAISGGKAIVGTAAGGIKETQEMIDFAAKHNILPEVEIIPMDYVNTAMDRLERADVKYRFVIDVANSLKKV
ncbi:alcohol dehydrogenase [Striga asiatica]|uniref:Alcohol dehydrogenase n=1 Tax=Striga asiatica TaxID=4170 RepID=A0A5A7P387_STRAF|nr:alcohol dehydrogenase [Striga asiatica]